MSEKNLDGYEWLFRVDPDSRQIVERLRQNSPWLTDSLVQTLYGDLYQRTSGLSLKSRLLVTIACAASTGTMVPQLSYQTRLALLHGITREEITEICHQISVFAGYAQGLNALNIVSSVFDSLESDADKE